MCRERELFSEETNAADVCVDACVSRGDARCAVALACRSRGGAAAGAGGPQEQPACRGRSEPGAARSRAGRVPGHQRPHAADGRTRGLRARAWPSAWSSTPAEEPAGAPVDARDLRADLRDLQDLPDHAGQVHPAPRALHRRDHGVLLRRAAALRAGRRSRSSCSSAWSASPAATASRGSASASTRSPTRAPRSPACAASRIRSTPSRSAPA